MMPKKGPLKKGMLEHHIIHQPLNLMVGLVFKRCNWGHVLVWTSPLDEVNGLRAEAQVAKELLGRQVEVLCGAKLMELFGWE